jgi:hypothetical protein
VSNRCHFILLNMIYFNSMYSFLLEQFMSALNKGIMLLLRVIWPRLPQQAKQGNGIFFR